MPRIITIVFDIDGTLAGTSNTESEDLMLFFHRRGALIKANDIVHYVYPGVLELMKILFSKENVRVAFFSSGPEERNEAFVKSLLTLALGQADYEKYEEQIIIRSKEHLEAHTAAEKKQQRKQYGFYAGAMKKDITLALSPGASLENAILVDDDDSFVPHDQLRNYLRVDNATPFRFTLELGDGGDCVAAGVTDYSDRSFQRTNGIASLTGLLLDCIEDAEKVPIQEKLFALNFERLPCKTVSDSPAPRAQRDRYQPRESSQEGYYIHGRETYYNKGIAALRELNPALSFHDAASFSACIESDITPEEQVVIDDLSSKKGAAHQTM